MAIPRIPRPRAAIEADLRAIPAQRARYTDCDMVSLLAQEIIDRRVNRLLDELWAGMPPHARAMADMRAEAALAA